MGRFLCGFLLLPAGYASQVVAGPAGSCDGLFLRVGPDVDAGVVWCHLVPFGAVGSRLDGCSFEECLCRFLCFHVSLELEAVGAVEFGNDRFTVRASLISHG